MKREPLLPVPALRLVVAILLGGSAVSTAQSPVEQAREGEARQQQIHSESGKLIAQLDAMLDEYDRNGITGEDAQNLKNLRAVLSRMSDKDMQKVLELLRQASQTGDPGTALKTIAQAYSAQKNLLVQMKHILATHARSQELLELSHRMEEIADRQASNLQTGIETANWTTDGNRPADEVAASLEGQLAEQKAIAEELKLLKEEIQRLGKNPANKEVAARFAKALQEVEKVAPALDAAAKALGDKQLFNAVTAEKAARDQMRQLARTLAPPKNEAEALKEATGRLEKVIAQQESVLDTTKRSIIKPIEQWLESDILKSEKSALRKQLKEKKMLDKPIAELKEADFVKKFYAGYKNDATRNGPGLESRQGDIVTQSEALSQDLVATAKSVSDALRSAIPEMQEARAALTEPDMPAAADSEQKALAVLKNAKSTLEQRLAAVEGAAESGDPVADLQKLQQDTQKLSQQQNELAKVTPGQKTPEQNAAIAQQQKALEAKAAELQARTAEKVPAASQALGQAAAQMQQATNAVNANQQPQAAGAQAQAMQSLAAAQQQLNQQLQQMQQAQQAAANAQKSLDELAAIIEAQQKLQIETATAAVKEKASPQDVKKLAPSQQNIQRDTTKFQQAMTAAPATPGAMPPTQAVATAITHMTSAHGHLQNALGSSADPEEKKALACLFQIQDKLEDQLAAAQQQMGMDGQQQDANAQEPAGLDALQQQVAGAQQQLQEAGGQQPGAQEPQAGGQEGGAEEPQAGGQEGGAQEQQAGGPGGEQKTKEAAGDLKAAADAAAGMAANSAGLPQGAQEALRDAAGSLGQAAAQAQAGNNAEAQQSAQKGADALAAAQAAVGQAQAGITAGPPQAGPPGPPGPPVPGMEGSTPGPSNGDGEGSKDQGEAATVGDGAVASGAKFLGLPARERITLQQSQSEKYPQEYAAQVEQYLQNLADESNAR